MPEGRENPGGRGAECENGDQARQHASRLVLVRLLVISVIPLQMGPMGQA